MSDGSGTITPITPSTSGAVATSIDYLIPTLRIEIGDIDSSTYRYLDEWLMIALIAATRGLERYWDSKYIITDGGAISRNIDYEYFTFEEEDSIIQRMDERIIIVKAALIILNGSLENSAWNLGSWRDAEISYSNIASGSLRGDTIRRLQHELDDLIKAPMKRLTISSRMSILETDK
jgi:hypothetical protein